MSLKVSFISSNRFINALTMFFSCHTRAQWKPSWIEASHSPTMIKSSTSFFCSSLHPQQNPSHLTYIHSQDYSSLSEMHHRVGVCSCCQQCAGCMVLDFLILMLESGRILSYHQEAPDNRSEVNRKFNKIRLKAPSTCTYIHLIRKTRCYLKWLLVYLA